MEKPRFRYVLCRDVIEPRRAGINEAGIDFFIPKNLTISDLLKANEKVNDIDINGNPDWPIITSSINIKTVGGLVSHIILGPSSRIIIPSGVCGLLEPSNSMLMAANKSGVSTKKGLIYGAEIVDSTYTGEIHISLINTSDIPQVIDVDEKAALQFIHVPIYTTLPERITLDEFVNLSSNWSDRGSNWQGSTDNGSGMKDIEPYDDKPNS